MYRLHSPANPLRAISSPALLQMLGVLLLTVVTACSGKASGPNSGTPQSTDPAPVTGFQAAPGDGQILLTWSNPSFTDFAGVTIVRKTGSAPTGFTDGTVVYTGIGQSHRNGGLTNDTHYFYASYAFNGAGSYSDAALADAAPFQVTSTTTYYVSPSGEDSNDGLTPATAWKLDRVNPALAGATEPITILFQRGAIFRGQLRISGKQGALTSPFRLGAYGTGDAPVLSGGRLLEGNWTQVGNTWRFNDPTFPEEVRRLFVNDQEASVGRYPETGYLVAESGTTTQVQDTEMTSASGYWDGAQIVSRTVAWSSTIARVSSYVRGATQGVFVHATGEYSTRAGSGYFLRHHVNAITASGQWAYDAQNKLVWIRTETPPAAVEATIADTVLSTTNSSNILVEGLTFQRSNGDLVSVTGGSNLRIQGCTFRESGVNGISVSGASDVDVRDNTFREIGNNAIDIDQGARHIVQGNDILHCGFVFGQEQGGTGTGLGIHLDHSDQDYIQGNRVDGTSYHGIGFWRTGNITIHQNFIRDFNHNKSDGGAIYTWRNNPTYNPTVGGTSHGGVISYNIIVDGRVGQGDKGSPTEDPTVYASYGIYIDDDCQDFQIHHNTVTGCSGELFNHTSRNIDMWENTVVSDRSALIMKKGTIRDGITIDDCDAHDNRLVVLYSGTGSGPIRALRSEFAGVNNTFRNDLYYAPLGLPSGSDKVILHYTVVSGQETYLYFNAAEWMADTSVSWVRTGESDQGPSYLANSSKPREDFVVLRYNASANPTQIQASELPYSDYIHLDRTAPAYPITLPPYESVVLVRTE